MGGAEPHPPAAVEPVVGAENGGPLTAGTGRLC